MAKKAEICMWCPKRGNGGWCAVRGECVPPHRPACEWRKRFHRYPTRRSKGGTANDAA